MNIEKSIPLISVIVPVYKVEDYLDRCIKSILDQTYSNLEIILVDDGSPDNCPQMCDDYAKKDSRVKVIHKKNGGLSSARNAGLDLCSGEYISFVDSDDYVDKRFIELLYKAIHDTKSCISICGYKCFYNDSFTNKSFPKRISGSKYELVSGYKAVLNLLYSGGFFWVIAPNKLYKAELFKTLRYPVGKMCEDSYTTYKLFFNSKKVVFFKQQLYHYLQRNESIMHMNDNLSDFACEAFTEFEKEFFLKLKKHDKDNQIRYEFSKKRANLYLDDYYRAYKKHNSLRMDNVKKLYESEKAKMLNYGGKLTLKFRLFDICKLFFVFAMDIFYMFN